MSSLSGKYFNLALGFFPGLVKEPLTLQVDGESVRYLKPLEFAIVGELQVLRVILETVSGGKVVSRHSNVVILDYRNRLFTRFEPMVNPADQQINLALGTLLKQTFGGRGITYTESDFHPQSTHNGHNMCVAFTIKFALDYIRGAFGQSDFMEGSIDEFARALKTVYNLPKEVEDQDVEFGPRGFGGGFGAGLLGGALVGGLVAAPLIAGAAYGPRYYPYPYYYY